MNIEKGLRDKILDAAAVILYRDGAKKLTQPEVARALGIRQSHLTYYFPRRADLLSALALRFLEGLSIELAALEAPAASLPPLQVIAVLYRAITEADSMRAFLALIVEAEQDDALRVMLANHMAHFDEMVARYMGHPPSDSAVRMMLAALRGIGLENLLCRPGHSTLGADVVAAHFGLIQH